MRGIIAQRAARGAEFMDRVRPGWFNEIRLDDLEMLSLKDCILGQIYGSYSRGLLTVGLNSLWMPVRYGFALVLVFSWRLTRAWRREIEQRRVQDFFAHVRDGRKAAFASV